MLENDEVFETDKVFVFDFVEDNILNNYTKIIKEKEKYKNDMLTERLKLAESNTKLNESITKLNEANTKLNEANTKLKTMNKKLDDAENQIIQMNTTKSKTKRINQSTQTIKYAQPLKISQKYSRVTKSKFGRRIQPKIRMNL